MIERVRIAPAMFCVLACACGAFAPRIAEAALVRISFVAVVQRASAGIAGGSFATGNEITGSLTFDTLVGDSDPSPATGLYYGAVRSFDFAVGGYSGTFTGPASDPSNITVVYDDSFVPPVDQFTARSPFTGPAVNGFTPSFAQFGLFVFNTSVLTSDALPTASEINAFAPDYHPLTDDINFAFFGSERLDWTLRSFLAVPEPTTGVLTVLGLAWLWRRRRTA